VVGEGDVVAPHVELPLSQAQDAAKHVSGVDADPHVHVESGGFPDEPDGFDHLQAHVDTVVGVIGSGNRQPGHAVIAVAQYFDPHALVVLKINQMNY
jgi:hypothetical protein